MLLVLLISICLGKSSDLKERKDSNLAEVKTITSNDTIQIIMGYFLDEFNILNEHNYTYDDNGNNVRGIIEIEHEPYFAFMCQELGNFSNSKVFYVNDSQILLLSNFLKQFINVCDNCSIHDFIDSEPLNVTYTSTEKNFFVAFEDGTIMTITEEPGSKYESFTYNFDGTFTYKFGSLYTRVYGHGDSFHNKIIDYVV